MEVLAQIVVWLNAAGECAWAGSLLAPIGVAAGLALRHDRRGGDRACSCSLSSSTRRTRRRSSASATTSTPTCWRSSCSRTATAVVAAGAGRVLLWARSGSSCWRIVPMLVMIVPVALAAGPALALVSGRPLRVGEEAVVTLKLNGDAGDLDGRAVSLEPTAAVEVVDRPGARAQQARGLLERQGASRTASIASLSGRRPDRRARNWRSATASCGSARAGPAGTGTTILLNPGEPPFRPDSPVQSIEIDYPDRSSWTSGTDSWVIYWFVVSMVAALCFRRALKVNV